MKRMFMKGGKMWHRCLHEGFYSMGLAVEGLSKFGFWVSFWLTWFSISGYGAVEILM